MKKVQLSILMLAAGLAVPAFAQDSVSSLPNGLPGDALDPYNLATQRVRYVTTLTEFNTSWGTPFGVAPVIKSSAACTNLFTNNLISAQAHSATLLSGIDVSNFTYRTWDGPGFGVNPSNNFPGVAVSGPANSIQLGLAFNESAFSSTCQTSNAQDNLITALVNFDPAQRDVLYVTRMVAAVNKPSNTGSASGSVGVGGVDAFGNAAVRVDNFGASGAGVFPAGSHYIRVRSDDRNFGILNQLVSPAGGTDVAATDYLVNINVTHNTPTIVGEDLGTDATGAPRSIVLGSNFNREYRYEATRVVGIVGQNANVLATTAHRPGTADHRGGIAFSKVNLFGGAAVGTATMLVKSGDPTDGIAVWGVDSNGAVTTARTVFRPNSVSDNCDQFTVTGWEFDGYRSQTVFQGGNGQATVGQDKAGRGLVAGVLYDVATWGVISPGSETFAANPFNAIAVGRFDPTNANSQAEWALAAWVNFDIATRTSTGKPILDGPGGAPIGRLCSFVEVHQDPGRGLQWGPDFSMPVFDSVGNIWFVSFVELFDRLPGGASDFDSALIRAVYNPDTFCYELEKVIELGDVFQGQDSNTPYSINFMEIVDGNGQPGSSSSIGSGAMFSQNGTQAAWANNPNAGLPERFPQTLGGIILNASLTYDKNNNGEFDDTVDEEYNAVLYIGNVLPCPSDITGDGVVDFGDFLEFFNCFDNNLDCADIDLVPGVDFGDFLQFFNSFDVNC